MKINNKPSIVFEDESMIKYLGITQRGLEIITVQRYPSCGGMWIVIRDNNIIYNNQYRNDIEEWLDLNVWKKEKI